MAAEIQPVVQKATAPKPAPTQAAPVQEAPACTPINVRWQWGAQADGSPLSGVITVTDAKTPQEAIEIIVSHFRKRCAIYATPEPSPKKPLVEKPAKSADKPKKKLSPNRQPQLIGGDTIDVTKGEPGLSPSRK